MFDRGKEVLRLPLGQQANGTLYVGVTSNLPGRVWQHRNKVVDGFTAKYRIGSLVYFEVHESSESAIRREKQIKKWNRAWKIQLIEQKNPAWRDLYNEIV